MVLQKLDTGELLPHTIVTKVAYATQGRNHLQQNAKVYEDAHVRPTSCWIISLISTAANKGSTCMTLTRCASSHVRWRLVFHHTNCKPMM
jgi:hypothetical protein